MLNLILGRAGTGKTTVVLRRLCAAGASRRQVLMVPEQQSHEAERELCREGGDGVSLFAEVLSFTRLAGRVFQAAGGLGVEELDAGGRLLLMYNAVKESAENLTVFGQPSRRPAFLSSLLATADELKSCCVEPEALMKAGQELGGPDGERLNDLGSLCAAYDNLTARGPLDPRDRLTRVVEKLRHCPWAEGRDIWLDGFTDFTPQQREVLRELLRQAESVTVTLTCDTLKETEGGTGIFSPARRTGAILQSLAKELGIPCHVETLSSERRGAVPQLQFLERELFASGESKATCEGDAIEIFQADSVRSEVEWTASRILSLVRSGGYRFRDIGVVARSYSTYRDLIESVFPRYGVPVFSSAMTDILEKPVLALVTAALDASSGGYSYDDMFRYLKTGLTDLSQEDRDLLENYVICWNIRGSQWTQKKPWSWHPRGYGLPWKDGEREHVAHLDELRRQIVKPLESLTSNAVRTGRGHAVALYDFLETIGLPDRLQERVKTLRDRGQPALSDEYRQLWDILCRGLEQCSSLLGDTRMGLDEFAQLFRLVLSQYDVGTIPVSLDRVTAGETTRQTGHRVKVLFLLGADDASIPQTARSPGLLSDDDRSLLHTLGLELGDTARDLLYREMTTVYLTCSRPTEKLIVSWPGCGPGGEERRPCFLVGRLRRLFPKLPLLREEDCGESFRLEAPLPALEQAGRLQAARDALELLPEYAPAARLLDNAADWKRGQLSREAVDRLYGEEVSMSASRMDKFKSCHFSYFMRYGLEAEPRKAAGFSAPEYGTFVHYVLEHVLQRPECRMKPEEWTEERREKIHRLTEAAVQKYVDEELGGLEEQSDRFRYLFRRLLRPVQAVVDNTVEELASSSFEPIAFELGFARDGKMPPVEFTADGVTVRITGYVDRVDGWEKDGRLYLRVADYKTGRKSFDFTEVLNGLGLQMLLYLFTLEDGGKKLFHKEIEGAGVLYTPAREIIVRGSHTMSEEERQKKVDAELTRSGLVLDDPEVLDAMEKPGAGGYRFLPLKVKKNGVVTGNALASAERLGRLGLHIQTVLGEICGEIATGNISADPYWRSPEKNACHYCEYAAACHFEERRGGDCRRWLRKVKSEEFWDILKESGHGNAV